jgi:hypothetical protein
MVRRKPDILGDLLDGGFLIDPDDEDYVAETIQLAEAAGELEWTSHKVVSRLPDRLLTLRRGFRPWPKPTPPGYRAPKEDAPPERGIEHPPVGRDAELRPAGTTVGRREGA